MRACQALQHEGTRRRDKRLSNHRSHVPGRERLKDDISDAVFHNVAPSGGAQDLITVEAC
jgi:hypothetical protein